MRESMNRAEFMRQLESLLQSIPAAEREEAIQYYSDYFDDAGDENEQDVIEALGNPARVAENIKRDLLESGYGEAPPKMAVASDRKLIEYGEAEAQAQTNPASSRESSAADRRAAENGFGNGFDNGINNGISSGINNGIGSGISYGVSNGTGSGYSVNNGINNDGVSDRSGYEYTGSRVPVNTGSSGSSGKSGWPGWAVALLVVGLVFVSPVVTGIIATLIGALATWFALILSFGVATLALFITFGILVVVGIMCMFVDPVSGVALVGGGLLCGGIGMLFLMLTVAMAGIVTPAIFKGIAFLFRRCKKK